MSSPGPTGIGGDGGEVDPAAVHLDEEQDVESAQRVGVDTQESVATSTWAWLAMNSLRVGPVRFGAGLRPGSHRILHTVRAARPCPSRRSSPWMRRYPQFGFSASRRSTSRRSSLGVGGRPVRGCGGWVQRRAVRRRCQPITVAGLTINITGLRPAPSNARDNSARTVRSVGVNLRRSICRLQNAHLTAKREDLGVTLVT